MQSKILYVLVWMSVSAGCTEVGQPPPPAATSTETQTETLTVLDVTPPKVKDAVMPIDTSPKISPNPDAAVIVDAAPIPIAKPKPVKVKTKVRNQAQKMRRCQEIAMQPETSHRSPRTKARVSLKV